MKLSRILLFTVLLLHACIVSGQTSYPSYIAIARKFFTTNSHDRVDAYDRVFFAKKKDGWHVQIISLLDQLNNNTIKNDQLFWSRESNDYRSLKGFGPGLSAEEAEKKITTALEDMDGPSIYGFTRCRYFGYNEWDVDMINDFGGKDIREDTLLEGLGRAYAVYAERYLWSGLGGVPYDDDPLKSKLAHTDMPGRERMEKFIYYINKGVDCYAKLQQLNPGYKMLVGSPKMKMMNELFHAYQQLQVAGFTKEAQQFMDKVPADDSLHLGIGYAYLAPCPPNSILITFGDNDTYPLWYVQQKKGFRKDVTVLNNSLLSFAPYVSMLKRDKIIDFSTSQAFINKHGQRYFPYDETGPPQVTQLSLARFIKDLQDTKHTRLSYDNDTLATYQVKNIDLAIDLVHLKKSCNQENLTSKISIGVPDYLGLGDLITLDIVNTYLYSRPLCFTSAPVLFPRKYLQQEATVYRLLPLDEKKQAITSKIENGKAELYLGKYPKPVLASFNDPGKYYEDALYGRYADLFAKIIGYYSANNDAAKARQWASRYPVLTDSLPFRYTISDVGIAEALFKADAAKHATQIIENIAINAVNSYHRQDMYPYYIKKESCIEWLTYLEGVLTRNEQSGKLLEKLREDLSKEGD